MGVAARSRPRALRLGVAGEVARWFETAIAFACLCLCGFETVVAFAGEKWAFFGAFFGRRGVVGFSGPVLGVSSGVVGFNVAMFLRAAREICRLARPDVGASTKKFALRAHNGQKLAFDGALGKYFRGSTVVGSHRAIFDATRSRQMGSAGSANPSMRS